MKPLIGLNFQTVLNPQQKNLPLKTPILSPRKRKDKNNKYKKLSTLQKERPFSPNPLYTGLLNEDDSKHNQKNIGPWTRPQIKKSENFAEVEGSSHENKFKIIDKFTRKTIYPNKLNERLAFLENNEKNTFHPIISPYQNFLMKISVRKAILEQEDDPNIHLQKFKSLINLPRFRSFRSQKLLPTSKSQKQKGKSLQFGKIKIGKNSSRYVQNQKYQSINTNSKVLIDKKTNIISQNYSITQLKVNNIELQNGKHSSRLAPIIHKAMKV